MSAVSARRDDAAWKGWAAGTITIVLWASAFVGIRYVRTDFSPAGLTLGRLLVGGTVLGGFAAVRRTPLRIPRDSVWKLLICGVAWFGIYNLALNDAERHIDAGIAAILVNIGPVLIALLAGVLLGEGFPRGLFIGGAVAFAGVAVIGASSTHATPHADLRGVVLCFVAALTYAIGVVAQKSLLRTAAPLAITWYACVIGAAVALPLAGNLVHDLAHARPGTIATVVYLGMFPTAVAFSTWAYALTRTSAGRTAALTFLVPPMAVVLGAILLGEIPPLSAVAGGALCLAGVYLTRRLR